MTAPAGRDESTKLPHDHGELELVFVAASEIDAELVWSRWIAALDSLFALGAMDS